MLKIELLKSSVIDYFTKNPESLELMQKLIQKRKKKEGKNLDRPLSGRLFDFFIVKYSVLHNTDFVTPNGDLLNVHSAYLDQCEKWKKRYFDPFARASLQFNTN